MTAQFGRWDFDGKPSTHDYLDRVRAMLAPYGPNVANGHAAADIDILCHAFHTTRESRDELQPHLSSSGAVVVWDGRLDNRAELISQLPDANYATDVEIVAASYEQWKHLCFAKFLGDWALSIWDPQDRSLLLAKDFVGVRPLYYTLDDHQLTWSSVLEPLVLPAGKTFALDTEYLAGWLKCFPAADHTPFVGILAVPPSSYVLVQNRQAIVRAYWGFDPGKIIRYRSDAEYEEHFRFVFRRSVRRRLRSDRPVLAELSGGVDSSAIVCIADELFASGDASSPRLDTISYYDEFEPNWNEKPYFIAVEQKRGRTGCHIDIGGQRSLVAEYPATHFALTPASYANLSESMTRFAACLSAASARVVLSGVGGDEFLGGVPTPLPELATLFAELRLIQLFRQMRSWALARRTTVLHLAWETLRSFLPVRLVIASEHGKSASWLSPSFAQQHQSALSGFATRLTLTGPSPCLQENLSALAVIRRQMACRPLSSYPAYETRYPFLDRDLLEFVVAIPRDQVVRPNQRRSLMRRALTGIVPQTILDRKRKSFVSRGPIAAIGSEWSALTAVTEDMLCTLLGIVNPATLRQSLLAAREGLDVPLIPLLRTLSLECWVRHAAQWGHLRLPVSSKSEKASSELCASRA